ncbi:transcriptional regulator [Nonomuraea sp. NPDC059023]|uniref:helix-turn-helix transcriptional regulator n=1 Tax=unclassified Nonomuraea TaxID=2593643 RepID=UPI0036CBE88D
MSAIEEFEPLLRPIMKAIAAAVGPHCEVVLHDLSRHDMHKTIAAIENGHVTGRQVGGPSTNLGLEVLKTEAEDHDEFGYRARTKDGRELRSSSVYIRDDSGRVVAAFCINVDMTPLQAARANLAAILDGDAPVREEIFASDIVEVLDNLIETAIGGRSVALMSKDDKLEVLRFLDAKGAFFVKRSIDRIARRLGISRVTAYNYLDQIRTTPTKPAL